jgi:proline racemase
MPARNSGQPGAPTATQLVAAGVQLLNELVRQLQTRMVDVDEGAAVKFARRITRLKRRNHALEQCVVFLASAVGMCPTCFGRAADCPACRGHGAPGQLAIDHVAFAEIIVPLFHNQPDRLHDVVGGRTVVESDKVKNGSAPHPPSMAHSA